MSSWMVLAQTWSSSSLAWCMATTGKRAICATVCGKISCAGDLMLVSLFLSSSSVWPSPLASNTWYGLRTHQLQARQVCWRCNARQPASVLLHLDPLHSWTLLAPAVFAMKELQIFSAVRALPCRHVPPFQWLFPQL